MFVSSLLTARHPWTGYSPGRTPFAYLQTGLRRSLEDAFNDAAATHETSLSMRLDVQESKDAFTVTADLPGLNESDLNLTVDDGVLTIAGEKKVIRDQKEETWHIIERASGSFERRLSISGDIDTDKITAKFDKGVLTVTLPKLPVAEKTTKTINITPVNS